ILRRVRNGGRWIRTPAGPAAGLAGPDCVACNAGKSRLSPFRRLTGCLATLIPPPLSVHEATPSWTDRGKCCTSEWNWGYQKTGCQCRNKLSCLFAWDRPSLSVLRDYP
ncbi:MAG: hypothetical protein OXF20_14765, partial [Gammaproteobacteria bacterium]|nr:hypothetical protein [Gammaproteobacteria bacterium]